MDTFYKNLGLKIKKLREGKGLSQEKLAEQLKIPRVSVSQIENGERKITAEELNILSKIFNIPSDILLGSSRDIKVILEEGKKKELKQRTGIRINVPQKNLEKFKEVLLYVLNKAGSRANIGETVLYKLLYFIDFDFYEKYEEQLVGATYMKNNYGPTPIEFMKVIEQMEGEDLVKVAGKYFQYPQTKYLPLRSPDLTKLKAHELDVIDDVLNRFSHMNANQISEYSHGDIPWLVTEDGEIINYETVFYRTRPYSMRSNLGEKDI